jgi:hypothetical protein
VAALATALGYEPSWSSLKQIRTKLGGGAPEAKSATPSASVGQLGAE